MSEHIVVSGSVKYIHIPYRKDGFAWCKHCKRYAGKLNIFFSEGMFADGMRVECGKCKKTIYVVDISNRKFSKDNSKCSVCQKKLSYDDAYSIVYRSGEKGRQIYCSQKCEKEDDRKWLKK